MNDYDVDIRLDEDFLFILNFSKSFLNNFTHNPEENELCQAWLNKLCCELVSGVDSKRVRNTYLCKLLTCMQAGALTGPFVERPNEGPLEALPMLPLSDMEPPWLKDVLQNEVKVVTEGGKDCRTYLNTKLLDNNEGACAYIAMSVTDEGKVPNWVQLGSGNQYDDLLNVIYNNVLLSDMPSLPEGSLAQIPPEERKKLVIDFHIYVINSIRYELANLVEPFANPVIEDMLEKVTESIKDSVIEEELEKIPPNEHRTYLLYYMLNKLINDLEKGENLSF